MGGADMKLVRVFSSVFVFSTIVLQGCGSGGSDSQEEVINTDYSQLKAATLQTEPLAKATQSDTFIEYLKNGLRLRLQGQARPFDLAEQGAVANDSASGFSGTNVHVSGVDEADFVKYDGEYLYIAQSPSYVFFTSDAQGAILEEARGKDHGIRILKTSPSQATVSEVAHIDFEDESLALSQLYLVSNEQGGTSDVASISHTQLNDWNASFLAPDWRWQSGLTQIKLFDVSTPDSPQISWNLELEGNLEGSRKIGNTLYLITRYIPSIQALNDDPITLLEQEDNERLILSTAASDLLPHYSVGDGEVLPLVRSGDCYAPENINPSEGYADVLTITALDLAAKQIVSSVCLNAKVDGIYSSLDSLYLGGSHGSTWTEGARLTALHKFGLNSGEIEYRGSGAVPGFMGWQDPAFRMDEYQGDLRIVTTESTFTGEPLHRLNVLRERGDSRELELVASLPNSDQPAAIGKPGEDIYAVRFQEERAFVVTFERIDPLYVIDLSIPEQPRIAGELEVPGFSSYLHPVGDNYLLSIGQEVIDERNFGGVKLELFDVSDIENPSSVNSHVVGERGSWTNASYDLRSISFLQNGSEQLRVALPIVVYDTITMDHKSEYFDWTFSGLQLLEINGLNGGGVQLDLAGHLVTEHRDGQQSFIGSGGDGRSILHDDSVFFVYGDQVWSSFWDSPSVSVGPL